jgi:hypothetical protein
MWRAIETPPLRSGAPKGVRDFDRRAFWIASNKAIELAYAKDHPKHDVLYGSDFAGERPGATILLPKGVPNGAQWNRLLRQLRGIANQRQPDIIDFTDRTMYEIKPAGADVVVGIVQGQSPIAIANAISIKEGRGSWHLDMCTWVPEHILPYPSDVNRLVCTGETDRAFKGLILYRVYRRLSPEEQKKYNQQTAVLTDFVPEMEKDRARFAAELKRVAPQFKGGTELWILCPKVLWEATVLKQRMDSRPFPGAVDIRRYPLMSGHAAMASALVGPFIRLFSNETVLILLVGAAACIVVIGALVLLPEIAVGAAAVTATEAGMAAATEEVAVVSLQAYRAARSAQAAVAAAREVSEAAAVLLVVVSTKQASAKTPANVTDVSAVRAVNVDDVPAYYEYGLDREVIYRGQSYRIVGRARVTG